MKPKSFSGSHQLGFGFDDAVVPLSPVTASRRTPKPPAVTPAVSSPAQATSVLLETLPNSVAVVRAVTVVESEAEAMAKLLDAHPDFRVLRRLLPRLEFPPASGPVATLLVLDTETTGLNPARDKVVELALLRVTVDLRTGQPVGPVQVYDGLEDPGQPMPDEIIAITGITDAMLRGQRLDEAEVRRLLDGVDLVLAHNAGFDRPFVEARLPQFAALNWACSFADIDWKQEGRGSAKLTSLAYDLGFFYDAHRAEMDCHALLAVLMASLKTSQASGLSRLIDSARSSTFRLQATNAPFDAKDLLKARGYRWDGAQKVWHTRSGYASALALECEWLKAAVYAGRSSRVQVEELDAKTNYSARPGQIGWREL
ncbi:MAG: 3'-5' exonuclease [Polaromonas sp.]